MSKQENKIKDTLTRFRERQNQHIEKLTQKLAHEQCPKVRYVESFMNTMTKEAAKTFIAERISRAV